MSCVREREIYPSAPIVLMAIEVRHPLCEPLDRKQVTDMSARVKHLLPLPSEMNEVSVTVQAGSDGPPVQQQVVRSFPRWTSRDKRTALSVRPDSLVIETTNYGSYDRMRELLDIVLRGRLAVAAPAGVERIGLRYIDEIRVPAENGSSVPTWEQWVDASLLGPAHVGAELSLVPVVNEGVFVFSGAAITHWFSGTARRATTPCNRHPTCVARSRLRGPCSSWTSTASGKQPTRCRSLTWISSCGRPTHYMSRCEGCLRV